MHPLKVSGSLHVLLDPTSFKHKPVILVATVRFYFSCYYSVTLINKHNTTHLIYWLYFQHCYMFRLSTSAIIRLASVHKKNKMLEVYAIKQWCKLVIVTTVIPYKRSNYMKECIRNFPGTIRCIGSNTRLECNKN